MSTSHDLLIVCLLAALILISCSGTSASQVQSFNMSADNPNDVGDHNYGSVPTSIGVDTARQDPLPGSEEFGMSMAEMVKNVDAVESLIATCMSEAGFEYIAVDFNTFRRAMVADKSLPGFSEREYIHQFGFGISTLYTGLPPQLTEVETPAQMGLGEQNIQIFRNLSPADQVAYNHTLFGEHPDATFAVALETEDFTRTGGCTRSAIEKVFPHEQLTATFVNPKDALIEQDPRMIAALTHFGDCMHAAGFDYSNERDIEPDLRRRVDAITHDAPIESLSQDAKATLVQLQGEERALAVVTYDCENQFVEPVYDQIERELYAGRQG